ncbi:hypothetical protein [Tychonema sp. LEGE 07203]|uniref:hypothetical protein n=1 Tax=Tychonema sp. LEGE 07203 TaxID=1828671 RepID=UPI00187E424A|nr:hypothetical protein [Tychonema sp. LEGE 07203]MBE9092395.1 hypothetical protein [Tychonema sp. LEGE 07203]
MTDPPIELLDLLDTDYADILASSRYPALELQLVKSGINPSEARIKTKFLTLVRQKPETPEEWATLTEAWEVACEYEPTVEDFRALLIYGMNDSICKK